jgi:hypothetical protein
LGAGIQFGFMYVASKGKGHELQNCRL